MLAEENIEQTDEALTQLVTDGIRFLESIARYHGPEKSIEIWEKMGEAMGQDLQGQVFFAMLTGGSGSRVYIQRGTCTQAVAAIKAIRLGTGLGLKDAKDIWDSTGDHQVVLDCKTASDFERRHMINELRRIGMRVL